jgi:hypothetical protein
LSQLELTPTTKLKATYSCNELPSALAYSITELSVEYLSYSCIGFHTRSTQIEFPVPRGDWLVKRYGRYVKKQKDKIHVSGEPVQDSGNIDFRAEGFAKIKGTVAPELSLAEVRGHSDDLRLADFTGKWVLLAFWAYG